MSDQSENAYFAHPHTIPARMAFSVQDDHKQYVSANSAPNQPSMDTFQPIFAQYSNQYHENYDLYQTTAIQHQPPYSMAQPLNLAQPSNLPYMQKHEVTKVKVFLYFLTLSETKVLVGVTMLSR